MNKPTIIDRAFMREVGVTGAAVTLVIVGILMIVRLVRFLAKAATGELPTDQMFLLLTLKVSSYLDLILPLVLYVAIVMVLGRWIRDNEFTVLQACGVGLTRLIRPTLILAGIVTVLVAVISLYYGPRALAYSSQVIEESKKSVELGGVVPGVFNDWQGRGVYYVERVGEQRDVLENVFAYARGLLQEDVVVANKGFQYVDETTGDRFLVLKNGSRYEGVPGQGDYSILAFETYALRIKPNTTTTPVLSVKAMSTAQLLKTESSRAYAEIHWRIAKPISVATLAFLALGFTYVSVRQAQFWRTVLAFATYFVYANLSGYAHAAIKKGKIDPQLGMWWVHALFLALAIYVFFCRTTNRPLIPGLKLLRPRR